ncbi:UNVERIFIED_ORG: hypothetical protein B5F06_06855 [Lacrimispora saccharolytica]
MRKSKFTAAAVIMGIAVTGLAITGCAGKTEPAETTAAQETAKMEELQPAETAESMEETEAKTEAAEEETKSENTETAEKPQAEAQAENGSAGGYEDNFAVDSAAAAEFAAQIKEAVAAKDLDALAELTAFPVYVGLPDVGAVETKEDFLALGADAVFTDELVASVADADTENMQPSMAGFSISDGGKANINFGVRDGVLAVSGINY